MEQLYDPENAIFIAYGALVVLALIPIYAGSFASVKTVIVFPVIAQPSTDKKESISEVLSFEDAKMFPLYGSVSLLSLYVICMSLDSNTQLNI